MSIEKRIPLYQIEMYVDEHETKEPANPDKADVFKVTLIAPKRSFKIGMDDAQAKLQIKALDDIVKHNLPLYGSFIIAVYPVPKKTEPQIKSIPTTLQEQ